MSEATDPLVCAILSMDAYARSSEPYSVILPSSAGTPIGGATIIFDSVAALGSGSASSGFYAVAYQLPDGSIVISYRGTVAGEPSTLVADALNGWGVGLGQPYSTQAELAVQFYNQVAQANPGATISVTGHSLGGGLAGFVGSLFGLSGVLFDSMDYAAEAATLYQNTLNDAAGVQSDPTLAADMAALSTAVYGAAAPWAPNGSGLSAFATDGEILTSGLFGLAGLGVGAEGSGAMLDPGGAVTQIPLVNAYDLHSSALLVCLLYAAQQGFTDWSNIGSDSSGDSALLAAMFDDTLGMDVGAGNASNMLTEIAYSAIAYSSLGGSPGADLPFGSSALPGLFADADILGAAIGSGAIGAVAPADGSVDPLAGGDVKDALCEILVQFAADQAQAAGANNGIAPNPIANGAFANSSSSVLCIDLNPVDWTQTYAQAAPDIVGEKDLLDAVVTNIAPATIDASGTLVATPTTFADNYLAQQQPTLIEAATGPAASLDDSGAAPASGATAGNAVLIGQSNSTITAGDGNDLIIGGQQVTAGNGNNTIVGTGSGGETINVGSGSNLIYAAGSGNTINITGPAASLATPLSNPGINYVYAGAGNDTININYGMNPYGILTIPVTNFSESNMLNLNQKALTTAINAEFEAWSNACGYDTLPTGNNGTPAGGFPLGFQLLGTTTLTAGCQEYESTSYDTHGMSGFGWTVLLYPESSVDPSTGATTDTLNLNLGQPSPPWNQQLNVAGSNIFPYYELGGPGLTNVVDMPNGFSNVDYPSGGGFLV